MKCSTHGRRQGGAREGRGPTGFSQTLSKTFQISKILSFLVVNTGSIRIGTPLKIFLLMLSVLRSPHCFSIIN